MVKFVKEPNIPSGNVRAVLIGRRYADILSDPLAALGVQAIAVDGGEGLDPRVSEHADMLAHHLGGNSWIAFESAANALQTVENLRIIPANVRFSATYPDDVALNVLRLGGCAYGRFDAACSILLEHLSCRGVEQVSVKQGYAKCSVCVVSRAAAITSDSGLATAMRSRGVDVLEIAAGGVRLDGYDSGFIGGASGLIAPDKLAFTGRLESLDDNARIREFLVKHYVRPIELTDGEMFDIGSILPITEDA